MAEHHRPLGRLSEVELEQALRELGSRLAHPPTPDLARAVRGRLAARPAPRRRFLAWPGSFSATRSVAAAAVVLLLLVVAVLAVFPGARTAVADRLGLRGIRIFFVDEAPTAQPAAVGTTLALGRAVTLEEARAEVDFPIYVPGIDEFSSPDEVYVLRRATGWMVSFVYRPRPGLPASPYSGVGALLTQFPGETDRDLIAKGLHMDGVDPETRLEFLTIAGEPGYWIEGAPHTFFMACDDDRECHEEWYRLAGNVLLWEQGGLTFRLESSLSREQAVAVAESMTVTP